ncbi:hypothetical protein [Nostoc piscinale]|uniref:hypothetical protein n=1 Tax=Nostoc piscinale TaxID=224012 RepID=UPI000A479F9D
MNDFFIISSEDILYQLKLSCQLPDIIAAIATRKIITDATNQADIQIQAGELQKNSRYNAFGKKNLSKLKILKHGWKNIIFLSMSSKN